MPDAMPSPITRRHLQRLRQMYRSAGWPCQDVLEVELLAAGLLERRTTPDGCETLRVTDAGIAALSAATAGHRAALSAHETLLRRVALDQQRAGRIAWRGLALRVPLPVAEDSEPNQPPTPANRAQAAIKWEANVEDADIAATPAVRWHMACPDLFSVSLTSVDAYLDPVVHEIKVSRADLLADLKTESVPGNPRPVHYDRYCGGSAAAGCR